MSEDRSKQLATILRAIEEAHRDKAEYLTEFKDRVTRLENAAASLTNHILSGQQGLPLEPAPEPPKAA